ncbi:hypothetical protein KFE25_010843 [Diacronema lutheri]|uniref:Uncharacterized protein n=3 Tax=Diacronema lutheri TaxID=2081491 RepID=A0A8J5X701_DIALT|nr:hypothetical protein KFE25_010843 [Diacronema lutheri]
MEAERGSSRGAALKPSELLPACIDIIGTFEPGKTTVDSHHAAYCARHKIVDASDVKFLHQVVYGCQRYKRLLKVFISSFYYNHSGEAARSDQSLYTVLAYLAILRLEELTFAQFKRLIVSMDFVKTRVFLRFLFSEEALNKWLKEGWLTLYEPHYVQTELIDQVLKFEPQVQRLVEELETRQAMGEAKKAAETEAAIALAEGRGGAGKHTVPQPFNLTRPAPRVVPEPTQVVAITNEAARSGEPIKARTWKRPDGPPKDQLELDAKKEQNRLMLRNKYADPAAGRFALRAEQRPTNLAQVRSELEERAAREHTFRPEPPKPVPKWDADEGYVKLNAAAVLREDHLYRRRQADEARVIKAFEEDLADTKQYDEWLAKGRAQEEAAARDALEARRADAAMADEMAKAAIDAARLERRALAARMRAEAEAIALAQEAQREVDAEARKKQVAAVAETHKNGALAVAEAERRRREAAEAVREESRALEAERRRAIAEEEARREEVIRQIRAIELVPRKRETVLDPTYEAGHGLLEEMSLAELRERLALARAREAQDVERRRAEIVAGKQEKADDIAARLGAIAGYRRLGAAQAEEARARARAEKAARAEADKGRREEATLKLEAAREELRGKARLAHEALALELRQIKVKSQFLGANKEAVEGAKFASLEHGAAREAAVLQRGAQGEAARAASVRAKEVAQRGLVHATMAKASADAAHNLALRLTNSAFDAGMAERQLAEQKRRTAAAERASKANARAAYAEAYPYSQAITQERQEDTRKLRAARGSHVAGGALHARSSSAGGGGSAASSLRLGNTFGSLAGLTLGDDVAQHGGDSPALAHTGTVAHAHTHALPEAPALTRIRS